MSFARLAIKATSNGIPLLIFLIAVPSASVAEVTPQGHNPLIEFSTYLGGTKEDRAAAITLDRYGFIYVVGSTTSKNFPTVAAAQRKNAGGNDAFVTKIDPRNQTIVYSTYLGGSDRDEAFGVAVDSKGNAYIAGFTNSFDFPVLNAYQPDYRNLDAFVTKLDAQGRVAFSTFLGGSGGENAYGIAYSRGKIYVTGTTTSDDFPVVNPWQGELKGPGGEAYLSVLNSDGTKLLFSTFIGGTDSDNGHDVVVDAAGNTYVTGITFSHDFPLVKPLQPSLKGERDVFVIKFKPDWSAKYSTFLGGEWIEDVPSIAADRYGRAHVTGFTNSSNFPVFRAFQPVPNDDSSNSFVSKIESDGSKFVFSTYLGGSRAQVPDDIFASPSGRTYVIGWTNSSDFPVRNSIQPFNLAQQTSGPDAYITKFSKTGSVVYSTYLGGKFTELGTGITVDRRGKVCVAGLSDSLDFPLKNAIQKEHSRDKLRYDIFVSCLTTK